ncbi:MAG TPA: alanine racemase [Candidatus Limnocylindrales bacterium]|nr:alanine racemase [Candidatus Limnocylindrales bacterium]
MRPPTGLISEAHDGVRQLYGNAIGRYRRELITPALVLELDVLLANLRYMESRLADLTAGVRAHVKTHKSPHIMRLQLEHGAMGVCTATIWEAIVMAQAGAEDILIANQLVNPEKRRAAAVLARTLTLRVNVDDVSDVEALSAAAVAAGSTIGVLVEVDTGMHRSGVDSGAEALGLARRITELPGVRMDGLSGYEGRCSLELDRGRRHEMQRQAMAYFVSVAEHLEANGVPCAILSAAGTGTAFWTGTTPRITELQLGSYAAMDDYHVLLEPSFGIATSGVATVISRSPDRLVLDLGSKTFGGASTEGPPSNPRIWGHEDLKAFRYDEEHAIFVVDETCPLKVGDVVDFHMGYTPSGVNYFDAYHVVEDEQVVDIWPIMPRGPQHGGLMELIDQAG